MIARKIAKRIDVATSTLSEAEAELTKLLDAIEVTPRADKKMIGDALQTALRRVVDAKAALAALRD